MTFKVLPLFCKCGKRPGPAQIGFTANHHLVVTWRCSSCKRENFVVKPLSECWDECPLDEREFAFKPEDMRFLHSLGVRLPDEG